MGMDLFAARSKGPRHPEDWIKAPPDWNKTLLGAVIRRLEAGESALQVASRFNLKPRAVEGVSAQLRDD